MSFTLLPGLMPWVVGFGVLVVGSLLLAAVAVADAVRDRRRAVDAGRTTVPAATSRPARRATARLHHA